MRSCLEEIIGALEDAGLTPLPLWASLSEPLEPGAYWSASLERQIGEHGLLRFELRVVEHTLADALSLAEEARDALARLAPSLTAELGLRDYSLGERAVVQVLYRRFF